VLRLLLPRFTSLRERPKRFRRWF